MGRSYSVVTDERGLPFVVGAALSNGGQPEALSYAAVHLLRFRRLYFNSIHYQGASKSKIVEDACRVMISDGSIKFIKDIDVKNACTQVASTELLTSKSENHFEKKTVTTFIIGTLFRWLRKQFGF
jgi:hypothetical protein